MRFSQYFGLNQKQAELDFVDIDVSRDTRLFSTMAGAANSLCHRPAFTGRSSIPETLAIEP